MSYVHKVLLCCGWMAIAAVALCVPGMAAAIGPVTVSVSAVNGTDRNLSNIVAETLITDLARQPNLRVVEAGASRSASRPRYRIFGSCLALDRHVLISVRVVDATSWTTLPGLADSVLAPRDQMLPMVDVLAERLIHKLAARVAPEHPSRHKGVLASRGKKPAARTVAYARSAHPIAVRAVAAIREPAPAKTTASPAPAAVHAFFTPKMADPAPAPSETYTGLIIDARGCHLERSMTPRIRLMDGSVLWAGEDASVDFAIENGVVAYARTLDEARQLARAGAHPLVLQAVAAYKDAFHSDPVLRDEDAQVLRPHLSDGFMRRFNVVFVVD